MRVGKGVIGKSFEAWTGQAYRGAVTKRMRSCSVLVPARLRRVSWQVWLVAKSPLALSTPVPDGWQAPDYLEEAGAGGPADRAATATPS